MFKLIFQLATEPLGLPIEWYYEYLILAIIGIVAYRIAYSEVGFMYRLDFISGSLSGSFFHWLIRLIVFAVLWAVTYGVIWIGKLVIANWQVVLLISACVVGSALLCVLAIFIIRKIKVVNDNA